LEDVDYHFYESYSPLEDMGPPPPIVGNKVRIRFDGSLQSNGKAGIGMWAMYSRTVWDVTEVFRLGIPIAKGKSIAVLEALAATTAAFLLSSIYVALECPFVEVIGDSEYVVKVLNCDYTPRSADVIACTEIFHACLKNAPLSVRWESREANGVCDALAKNAARSGNPCVDNFGLINE
jgi:ribonuclease HI